MTTEQGKKKRILFVDDEPNFLDGLRLMLRMQRNVWEMIFVKSVDEALDQTYAMEFDAIVSDVRMPGRDGFDLLAALRESEPASTTPVIILTGSGEKDLKRRALDLGATDLLSKPVNAEDLLARLRSVLRLKSYQDEIKHQNEVLEERVRERTADLEMLHRDIICRLAKAGEFRDEETGNHVMRVASCSRVLAEALALSPKLVERMFLASPLHDLGKIGIPDSILLKPGKLTPHEREIMEQHCEIGMSILIEEPKGMGAFFRGLAGYLGEAMGRIPDPLREMAATIAMSHHEKWDGSGYPRRLGGDAIPLPGLIVAVTDVYDALRAKRPYKEPFSVEKTLAIIRKSSGSHFSPEVVVSFDKVADEFERIREQYSN